MFYSTYRDGDSNAGWPGVFKGPWTGNPSGMSFLPTVGLVAINVLITFLTMAAVGVICGYMFHWGKWSELKCHQIIVVSGSSLLVLLAPHPKVSVTEQHVTSYIFQACLLLVLASTAKRSLDQEVQLGRTRRLNRRAHTELLQGGG